MSIHPTAVIGPNVKLGENVQIGPYAVIQDQAILGDGCRVGPHVHINGWTTIGEGTKIHAGAVIGDEPQDYSYKGGESYTVIGKNCTLREYTTIHRGAEEGTTTSVGDNCMIMGFVHLGHNCKLGDNAVVVNASLLAGHVEVGERAFISGNVAVHQFVRIGTMAMIGGMARISKDVPPYSMVALDVVQGPNLVGLKRGGLAPQSRKAVRKALKCLYFSGRNYSDALDSIREDYAEIPEVMHLVDFVKNSKRGILKGRSKDAPASE